MQTVIETQSYLRAAKLSGIEADELAAIVETVARDPEAGEVMPGCGGARKLRVARPGGGKSGGYRVVTYYVRDDVPVFLLTVFPKNVRTNLTKAEQNAFADLCKLLVASLGGK